MKLLDMWRQCSGCSSQDGDEIPSRQISSESAGATNTFYVTWTDNRNLKNMLNFLHNFGTLSDWHLKVDDPHFYPCLCVTYRNNLQASSAYQSIERLAANNSGHGPFPKFYVSYADPIYVPTHAMRTVIPSARGDRRPNMLPMIASG